MKLLLIIVMIAVLWSCEQTSDPAPRVIRSADPCQVWSRPGWQTGPDSIRTLALRDGKASHLSPAEIIYYSIIENSDDPNQSTAQYLINPVLILTYLESQSLLSRGSDFGDFELRLLEACSYGDDKIKKYHGFYPQLVSATYQWRLYQQRGLSFDSALVLYPLLDFKESYARYAKVMNDVLGTTYSQYPDSKGYYQDFAARVGLGQIQSFLKLIKSPLVDELFKQSPEFKSVIDYRDPSTFCE